MASALSTDAGHVRVAPCVAMMPSQRHSDMERVGRQLTAGGTAGAIARTVVAPLDRVKILLQTQRVLAHAQIGTFAPARGIAAASAAPSSSLPLPPRVPVSVAPSVAKYTAAVQTMRLIAREEGGARSLWRGNLTNIVRVVPYSAAQFATYDYLKGVLSSPAQGTRMSTVDRLACGAAAGVVATALTYPLDLVRLRQTVDPNLLGVGGAARQILAESGSAGFWRGLAATMWSLTPFIAINFATFDGLQAAVRPTALAMQAPTACTLAVGAASGLVAQTVCYPLDTVRRRLQLPHHPYRSMADACARMLREEGARAFYAGMGANAAKVVPLAAIRFVAYEQLKNMLHVSSAKQTK